MKIGITGCKGFIGSSVTLYLNNQGHEIVSLDNLTGICVPEHFENEDSTKDLNWIIHFGAHTSIPRSFENPVMTYYNNIGATLGALRIAHQSNAALIHMSSYVYGEPKYLPIDEKHPVSASNPYAESKIISEEICHNMMNTLPIVILRGFNIYGYCRIPGRLVPDLLECIRNKNPIEINDPYPKRDYLNIKDFQQLISRIISKEPIISGIFNVGYGRSYSNLEVAEIVRELAGEPRNIIIKSKRRQSDILECSADISLIKKTFSWEPGITLEAGLSELIATIKEQK